MINYRFFILILLLIFLSNSCSKNIDIDEYSKKLQLDFPKDMNLIYHDTQSEFQDYKVHSIYKVSFNQKSAMLNQIMKNICDSNEETNRPNSCWHNCEDYFSFEYNNETKGILIEVSFIAKNNMSLLSIYEVKI